MKAGKWRCTNLCILWVEDSILARVFWIRLFVNKRASSFVFFSNLFDTSFTQTSDLNISFNTEYYHFWYFSLPSMDCNRFCHFVTSSKKDPAALLLCITPSATWWDSSSSKIGLAFVRSISVPLSYKHDINGWWYRKFYKLKSFTANIYCISYSESLWDSITE